LSLSRPSNGEAISADKAKQDTKKPISVVVAPNFIA